MSAGSVWVESVQMLLAAALVLSSVLHPGQPHPPQVKQHHYETGGWRLTVGHDVFTDSIVCTLKSRSMHYRNETLIFHLKRGLETTHAYFKIDDEPARPVSDAFHDVETHGFFPRRGWVDDPAGGDVALPAAYVHDATRISIRASPKSSPRLFKVSRFGDALDRARSEGCTESSFKTSS
jgi:hypothetical protein